MKQKFNYPYLRAPRDRYILWFQVGISVCKLLGEVAVLPFVDRVGRRPMLLASSVGLCMGLGCLAISYADAWPAEYGVLLLGYGPTTRPPTAYDPYRCPLSSTLAPHS
jgi:MFS family permease